MINIVITGKRQRGKSTLAKRIIDKYNFSVAGYLTLPILSENNICGYKIVHIPENGMEEIIIDIKEDGKIKPFPSVFLNIGKKFVEDALLSDCDFIILDEIGRIEKDVTPFTDVIKKALDSDKNVIAVLKKEDIPFINDIKKRSDIYFWDIDLVDREKAFFEISNIIERKNI